MATAPRVNGGPLHEAFYGYQPKVIKVSCTGGFLASTPSNGVSAIIERGYEKAVRAVQLYASIIWLGEQDDDSFCCIVDSATFNPAEGPTTSGDYGALADSLTEIRDGTNPLTVTVQETLLGDGSFA